MNEIAVIEQMPIITERVKEIGKSLSERLEKLNLEKLVCNEENRKELKNLRSELNKEAKTYEDQRKILKKKVTEPYENFETIYKTEIIEKFKIADNTLKNKIVEVESEIKHNAEVKMKEFFEEYRNSKKIINPDFLQFHELDIVAGLGQLTERGQLVKKVKDEIKAKVDRIEDEIKAIQTMEFSEEILVEYLKTKDLGQAIQVVNDRHMILDTIRQNEQGYQERIEVEEQTIAKVDEALQSPTEEIIDGQMSLLDDFGEECEKETCAKIAHISTDEEVVQIELGILTRKRKDLRDILNLIKERGVTYESITD